MKNFKAYMIMILLGLCISIIMSKYSSADGTGNYPSPENGDWTIENETIVWNETIVLTGNLTIEKYGNLTFNNVTLIMNCSKEGEFSIETKNSSMFYILDFDNNSLTTNDRSNITSQNDSNEFKFLINKGTKFVMKNSELNECGYASGDDGRKGLTIMTNNTIIENSSFYKNYYGIYFLSSSNNTITNNNFYSNSHHGFLLSKSNKNQITNNMVYSNNNRGIYLWSSSNNNLIRDNNVFSNNYAGISLSQSSNNQIINNNISNNINIGISLFGSSNNQIKNNNISNNADGISFWDSSNNQIIHSTISNSSQYDFYFNDFTTSSNPKAINTSFNKYKVYFENEKSELFVQWYLNIKLENQYLNPIPNANIYIQDNENGGFYKKFITDSSGFVKGITLTEYKENKNFGKIHYTPHNIIAEKNNEKIETNITMNKSKTLKLVINEILMNISYKNLTENSVIITWETNELSNSIVKYGKTTYGLIEKSDTLTYFHRITLSNLESETLYNFRVNSTYELGNSYQSDDYSFTTQKKPPDIIPPKILNIEVAYITHNSVIITWNTDENSTSLVKYGLNETYGYKNLNVAIVTSHRIILIWLKSNTTCHFVVNSTDESGNSNQSKDFTFKTIEPPDTAPPEIYEIKIYNITQTSIVIEWNTNELSDSLVKYGTSSSYSQEINNTILTKTHSIKITELMSNTTYYFCIYSTDASFNSNSSGEKEFDTLSPPIQYLNVVITFFDDYFLSNSVNNKINITVSNASSKLGGVILKFGTIIDGKIEKIGEGYKSDINGNYIAFFNAPMVNEDTKIFFWTNASFSGYYNNNDTKKDIWIRVIKISKIEIEGSFPNQNEVTVLAKFIGEGITVKTVTNPGLNDYKNIDVFIEVKFTGFVLYWINISVYYKEDLLPENIIKENLRIYQWNEKDEKWEIISGSGVNRKENFVWANITHLTIFAPRDEFAVKQISEKYPILEITDISFSNINPKEGENIAINAKIHNKGKGIGENIKVNFYIDNSLINSENIDRIVVDDSKIVSVNWTARKGRHVIKIEVENDKIENIENTKNIIVEEDKEKSELSAIYGLIVLLIILIFILIIFAYIPNESFEIKKETRRKYKSLDIEEKTKVMTSEKEIEESIKKGVKKNE